MRLSTVPEIPPHNGAGCIMSTETLEIRQRMWNMNKGEVVEIIPDKGVKTSNVASKCNSAKKGLPFTFKVCARNGKIYVQRLV